MSVRAAADGHEPERRRRCPGSLLVGDAVGAVNPFNGEGIAYAIETGQIAADLVHEALINDRPALTMQYPQRARRTPTAATSRSGGSSPR